MNYIERLLSRHTPDNGIRIAEFVLESAKERKNRPDTSGDAVATPNQKGN